MKSKTALTDQSNTDDEISFNPGDKALVLGMVGFFFGFLLHLACWSATGLEPGLFRLGTLLTLGTLSIVSALAHVLSYKRRFSDGTLYLLSMLLFCTLGFVV